MNKEYSFSYEDTDKKIEIELYGLTFEIKGISKEKLEEYKNLDDTNIDNLEKELDLLLGEKAVEKINKKRVSDGYEEMSLDVISTIFGFVFYTYSKQVNNSTIDIVNKSIEDVNYNINRQNKRYNNYNNRNRRNYRRY